METAAKIRLALVAIAVVIVLIVIFQNLEPVPAQILFFSRPVSLALLLFVAVMIGFLLGLVTSGRIARRGKKRD